MSLRIISGHAYHWRALATCRTLNGSLLAGWAQYPLFDVEESQESAYGAAGWCRQFVHWVLKFIIRFFFFPLKSFPLLFQSSQRSYKMHLSVFIPHQGTFSRIVHGCGMFFVRCFSSLLDPLFIATWIALRYANATANKGMNINSDQIQYSIHVLLSHFIRVWRWLLPLSAVIKSSILFTCSCLISSVFDVGCYRYRLWSNPVFYSRALVSFHPCLALAVTAIMDLLQLINTFVLISLRYFLLLCQIFLSISIYIFILLPFIPPRLSRAGRLVFYPFLLVSFHFYFSHPRFAGMGYLYVLR